MAKRLRLDEHENHVVSVTPVARGLVRPVLVALGLFVLVALVSHEWSLAHRYEPITMLVVVGSALVVVATRTWRWRSHKIHVTSRRVIIEGGVVRHFRSSIELRDVVATHVDQRISERIALRGVVVLDSPTGPVAIGPVHHPGALCRLIDRERSRARDERPSFDTVFDYEETPVNEFWLQPRTQWRDRHGA